ncbi:MAG TPA: MarR family transcriptional regulator [Pseudonocardiaceae bacterium]|nr:MarR family transcriptional regulator [Pseudonocardiaceae bacterium]
MSRRIPMLAGRQRPANLGVLLREAFVALNNVVIARLADRGHGAVRTAHGVVFQYLDDTGTTVSLLAERAQITKQAMAELVRHLEIHGYVERVPHPTDLRAKLVLRPTVAATSSLLPSSSRPNWKIGSGTSSALIGFKHCARTCKPFSTPSNTTPPTVDLRSDRMSRAQRLSPVNQPLTARWGDVFDRD